MTKNRYIITGITRCGGKEIEASCIAYDIISAIETDDEELDAYVCDMRLDEDEMVRFLSGRTSSCPYYRFYDEYKSVQKQN